MRLSIFSLLCFLLLALSVHEAHALDRMTHTRKKKLEVAGCDSIRDLGRDIYKNSKPHRACSAHTCPIDYYELYPSLLVNTRGTPRKPAATLLSSSGKKLATCGQRPCDDCSTGVRYVCTGNTHSFAKAAKASGGNYTVFYKLGNVCVQINDVGRCNGSVKGLCNQTLH